MKPLRGIQIYLRLFNFTAIVSQKSCENRFKDAHISEKTVLYRNKREIIVCSAINNQNSVI